MKEIKCDFCKDIIGSDRSRIKGSIQKMKDEEESVVENLVWQSMDFCNEDCLFSYLDKLRNLRQ